MVALMLALASCTDESHTGGPGAEVSEPVFVGVAVCGGCHVRELERWRGSHHDLAMQEATSASVLGDFQAASFTHRGVTSRFFRSGGRFFVNTEGPEGEQGDYEVAYAFGVEPLQQYLIRLPGGRVQAFGVAWDTRPASVGGQRWFHLYPDETIPPDDELHWTGRNQRWNFMCADCHSTDLRRGYLPEQDRYDTGWAELDVACEACHGPGSEHVRQSIAAAQEVPEGDAGNGFVVQLRERQPAGWVFDPGAAIARRTREREANVELETCARCHSRRTVLRGTYRWGKPLLDSYRPALLDEPLYHADGQILDEVYVYGSFLQSRMYAAGVSCGDCHDPHALAVAANPDETCSGCHRPEVFASSSHHFHEPESTGASCVECHMPARTYMGVDARRDHSLRVPRPDLSVAIDTPNACTGCHLDRPASWAAAASERWWGPESAGRAHFANALHAGRRQLPDAERSLSELAADVTQPGIARATALRLLRDAPGPRTADAVARGTRDADGLVRMAALEAAESIEPGARLRLATPLLRDPFLAVRIEAARLLADAPLERLAPGDRPALGAALAEYKEAQLANADGPTAHLNLGILHARRGELELARDAYTRALQLAPRFAPTYVNLADLHRQEGRDEQAERVLRRALELVPDAAEAHHALGLTLVRRGGLDGALDSLARAAELAPERPRYAYVYGVALHSASQSERAIAVLTESLARHPGDRQLLMVLATLSRDLGRVGAALGYARELVERAPDDASARAFLTRLEAATPE